MALRIPIQRTGFHWQCIFKGPSPTAFPPHFLPQLFLTHSLKTHLEVDASPKPFLYSEISIHELEQAVDLQRDLTVINRKCVLVTDVASRELAGECWVPIVKHSSVSSHKSPNIRRTNSGRIPLEFHRWQPQMLEAGRDLIYDKLMQKLLLCAFDGEGNY